MSSDEQIDIVDERGSVLRQASKHASHKHGWLHKTVIGCLKDGDDWLLVRQTPDRQDAGQFVSPVGGHVQAGESNEAAFLRETEEELGVRRVTHTLKGTARFHRQVIGRDENHLFYVFEFTTPDRFVLGSEAEAIEQFKPAQLTALLTAEPQSFGDALYFVLEHFYPELLPKSYTYKWHPAKRKQML